MRHLRTFLFLVSSAFAGSAAFAQIGDDYLTFGSFEGFGDNDGQSYAGRFIPCITTAQNFQGFTCPTLSTRCWDQSRWPDTERYYWRYNQSTVNNNFTATSNINGRLIHRLNTGNSGMAYSLNGPSWDGSIWNNQYLKLQFSGPTVPARFVMYQELRDTAAAGTYTFTMRFRSNSDDLHVSVYEVNDNRIDCNEVDGYSSAPNLVADFADVDILAGNAWNHLTSTYTTTSTHRSLLIAVTHVGETAPAANTTMFFDDIHLFADGCAPGWNEPQSIRNTYGSLSTGDICAFLAASIATDGSPTHAFIDRFRALCGMDACTPADLAPPPMEEMRKKNMPTDLDHGAVRIAPNPSEGRFLLTLSDTPQTPVLLVVYDATGRAVWTTRTTDLRIDVDLAAQPAGAYLLEVQDGERVEHAWLVKE